jgi:putative hydroxymethylpyrimidine transport system permease protein
MYKIFGLVSLIILLLSLWSLGIYEFKIPSYFLPTLPQVIASFIANGSTLFHAAMYTFGEAFFGLILAFILALTLAILCYFLPFLAALLQPLSILSQALPLMILAPLIVLWLGFGWSAKLTIVALSLFFPMFIAMMQGFKQIPQLWLELAYTFEARRGRLFFYLILPGSLNYIISGIKIALAWSMLAAVIAEWVGGNQGLGFLMQNALSRMDSAFLFANLFLLIGVSLCFYSGVSRLCCLFDSNKLHFRL